MNINTIFPEYEKKNNYYLNFLLLLYTYFMEYSIYIGCILNQLIIKLLLLIKNYSKIIKEKSKKLLF